jgi:hypothetical protein
VTKEVNERVREHIKGITENVGPERNGGSYDFYRLCRGKENSLSQREGKKAFLQK